MSTVREDITKAEAALIKEGYYTSTEKAQMAMASALIAIAKLLADQTDERKTRNSILGGIGPR